MNIYVKLGLISFLAGTLGASLPIILNYGLNDFGIWEIFILEILLRGMFWGGLPSTVLLIWRMKVWKKSGKPEKGMSLYCFIVGFIIGLLAYPFLLIAGV